MSFGQRDHYMERHTPLARGSWNKSRPKKVETKSGAPKEVSHREKRKRLKRRCDRHCSELVRELYGPTCFVCKVNPATENGHFYTRKINATRWDWHEGGNCMPSCGPCNFRHQSNKDPYLFSFVEAFGTEAFAVLRERAKPGRKFGLVELQELSKELWFQLKQARH